MTQTSTRSYTDIDTFIDRTASPLTRKRNDVYSWHTREPWTQLKTGQSGRYLEVRAYEMGVQIRYFFLSQGKPGVLPLLGGKMGFDSQEVVESAKPCSVVELNNVSHYVGVWIPMHTKGEAPSHLIKVVILRVLGWPVISADNDKTVGIEVRPAISPGCKHLRRGWAARVARRRPMWLMPRPRACFLGLY